MFIFASSNRLCDRCGKGAANYYWGRQKVCEHCYNTYHREEEAGTDEPQEEGEK